jgi:hypothetical protein
MNVRQRDAPVEDPASADVPARLAQLYDSVPVRSAAARETPLPDGLILEIPGRNPTGRGWWMARWFLPRNPIVRLQLDPLGLQVYRACDGHATVREIIRAFADEHRLGFIEARLLVTTFLRTLIQRGLVGMAGGGSLNP